MSLKSGKPLLLTALLAAFLFLLSSCHQEPEDGDQYVSFTLHAGYADYDSVVIRLVDASTNEVYETVWNKKLPDPVNFPKHKLNEAKGKDFIIQIRGYNGADVALSKDLKVEKGVPGKPLTNVADLRLLSLKLSVGELSGGFKPGTFAYTAQVGEDVASVTVTAVPIDPGNAVSVDDKPVASGQSATRDLALGSNNVIAIAVKGKDGKQRAYEVRVTRGRVIRPEEVRSVTISDRALTLYTGDAPTKLTATVDPPGAMLEWTSNNGNVARVDGNGKVEPVAAGDAKIIVKAGDFADTSNVKVKKDAPVISVGENIAVKPGTEVVFNIALSQEHGTFTSFKYDLDADGKADNTDTANAPATRTLKHTYAAVGSFDAWFEATDSEGNTTRVIRTITVDNGAFQIAITSPSRDTAINSKSILIKYTVNGTPLEKTFSDLKEGTNPVTVDTGTGADKRSATRNVTVDTKAPNAPLFTGNANAAVLKPTWTWKTGGDGSGSFRSSLDSAGLAVATPGTSTQFMPADNLIPGTHTLWVQESDSVGNWSEPGRFKVTIKIPDTTPPNAPTVVGPASTPTVPKWTWTTGGGGGNGVYKRKLGDSTLAGASETTETEYTLEGTPEANKSYTLWVAERDSAGNFSKSAKATIAFEPNKPGVVILSPAGSGTFYTNLANMPFNGTAGGTNPIAKVSYKINGVAAADAEFVKPSWSIPSVPFADGSPTLVTIVATDNLGITGEATLTVLRDNTKPSQPNITTTPPSPTKSDKGAWAWTKGTDNTGGSDLNGKYQWSLDGTTWTGTEEELVNDVPLKEGSNTFFLQEQDKAGNWSASASRVVVSDRSGPVLAISTPAANATLGSTHVTVTGTASDAFTSVASISVSGQESGNGAGILNNGNWTTGDLVLRSKGLDTLTVTATDAVGNPTVRQVIVTVSVAANSIEIVYPSEGMFYNQDSITVRYRVNGSTTESKKLFNPLTTEGNIPLEVETPPNEANEVTKKVVTIYRDKTLPTAPVLSPVKTPTNLNPGWTWTAGSDAGSGLMAPAAYRYQLNGAGAYTNTGTASYTHTGAAEGTYRLVVQVQDKAGNWSANSNSVPIVVDKTLPTATVTSPQDGYVTGKTPVMLSCGGDAAPNSGNRALTAGSNILTCSATDSAGNVGSKSITVWYLPNTVFVKSGGTGLGTSWVDAAGNLQTVLKNAASGTSVWAAGGVYSSTNQDSGFVLGAGVSFFGGFPATGITAKSLSDRVFAKADTVYLHNPSGQGNVVTLAPKPGTALTGVTVNGVQVILNNDQHGLGFSNGLNIMVRKVKFLAGTDPTRRGIDASNSAFAVDSCIFTSFSHEYNWIYAYTSVANQQVTISNSLFTGNVWFGGAGMYLGGYAKATFTNVWFMDTYKSFSGFYHLQFSNNAGELNLKDCVFKAANENDAITSGTATRIVTTTTFSATPPAPPQF